MRRYLRCRGIEAFSPQARHRARRGTRSTGPPTASATGIERTINRLKQHRAVATRYEKLETTYHALLTIAAILCWL